MLGSSKISRKMSVCIADILFLFEICHCLQLTNKIVANGDEPEWMLEHARRERKKAVLDKRQRLEERLARVRAEEERQRRKLEDPMHPSKKLVCCCRLLRRNPILACAEVNLSRNPSRRKRNLRRTMATINLNWMTTTVKVTRLRKSEGTVMTMASLRIRWPFWRC